MEIIGTPDVWSFLDHLAESRLSSNEEVRSSLGHAVDSYLVLAKRMAELQFRNPGHVLLFRGQQEDHRDLNNRTTLKPRIFRPRTGIDAPPAPDRLAARFELLGRAEELLSDRYHDEVERLGKHLIRRFRIVRWAILQHYEVCRTPLLDVTHSLRIAASFASLDNSTNQAYLFVLGVPNVSGAITVNAESGLQIIRLASVCPPSAMRPHLQDGYLLGEYPDMVNFDQKRHYPADEVDFGLRLLAKFTFDPQSFWHSPDFPRVERPALYPNNKNDPIFDLTDAIRRIVRPWSNPSM